MFHASGGAQGIQLQRKSPVVPVITDILMPEKEGIETCCSPILGFPAALMDANLRMRRLDGALR